MTTSLVIRDETLLGQGLEQSDRTTSDQSNQTLTLSFLSERITVETLIRNRICQEVADYNARLSGEYYGLVMPSEAEQTLNGCRLLPDRKIDWQKQYERAIAAFLSNGFIILIDDQQVSELDTEITIRPDTSVTFLKLVPLVGG
jgi:hypothetical protein